MGPWEYVRHAGKYLISQDSMITIENLAIVCGAGAVIEKGRYA